MARSKAGNQNSLNPFYAIIGVVALVGVAIIAYQMFGGGDAATAPVAVEIDQAELARVQGISIGDENAPVVIYEFADFQCPGCGSFAGFIAPLIKERLVEPGIARFVYYDFPLVSIHPNAFLASRAGRCANDQDRFWDYHDVLYARQSRWSPMRDATSYFVDVAAELGLNRPEFDSCLRSDRHAEEVTRSMRLGESLGVQGTPTLLVNGRVLGSIPSYAALEELVLAEAGRAPAAQESTTDTTADDTTTVDTTNAGS